MKNFFVHEKALVETETIGDRTKIWAFAHVMKNAQIGSDCNVGDHAFVESGAIIGNQVTIKNGVMIWEGVEISDNVFIGPNVIFTNDLNPRSPRAPFVNARYETKKWLSKTIIREGVSLGANSTIISGIEISNFAMVAAGSVVTKDVAPYSLVMGVPARQVGYVCQCGQRLILDKDRYICSDKNQKCQKMYKLNSQEKLQII